MPRLWHSFSHVSGRVCTRGFCLVDLRWSIPTGIGERLDGMHPVGFRVRAKRKKKKTLCCTVITNHITILPECSMVVSCSVFCLRCSLYSLSLLFFPIFIQTSLAYISFGQKCSRKLALLAALKWQKWQKTQHFVGLVSFVYYLADHFAFFFIIIVAYTNRSSSHNDGCTFQS